jgi:D-alanyl-lipoteichoic acid acyltransferase DltB (MBOAT superfamily)
LAGLSLILHFGILNLSTALWRRLGVDVSELFRSPYKARSLKEFWGKRWNLAFSEMTALIAYRPLKYKIGAENAVIISFLVSGLLHEIAISFPVSSGYGLPLLYFIIHAVAMQLEAKSLFVKRLLSHRLLSHIWVLSLLVIPMPILFHRAFVSEVLIPLREMLLFLPAP